eukprot:s5040_g14.t1
MVRTGEDEYERHEQEKKLKEYVGNNQVKNLIRLIQVLSVIRPSTAVWIKGSAEAVEAVEASVGSGIMEGMDTGRKFTVFEVVMLIAVILLIAPHVLEALKKLGKIYARMSAVGMVKVHSGSRSHKESCRYVQGTPRTGTFHYLSTEDAREQGYRPCYVCWPETRRRVVYAINTGRGRNKMDKDLGASSSDESWEVTEEENEVCNKVCYWCEQRKCSRKKVGHVWCSCEYYIREYASEKCEQPTRDHSWNQGYAEGSTEGHSGMRTEGQSGPRRRPVQARYRGGTASRGRAAMEGTIGQGTVSGQERLSEIPEGTYEDQVSTNTNNEERIVYNGQEMTLEEMGRQQLPDVVQERYEEYLRTRAEEASSVEASTEEKIFSKDSDNHQAYQTDAVDTATGMTVLHYCYRIGISTAQLVLKKNPNLALKTRGSKGQTAEQYNKDGTTYETVMSMIAHVSVHHSSRPNMAVPPAEPWQAEAGPRFKRPRYWMMATSRCPNVRR